MNVCLDGLAASIAGAVIRDTPSTRGQAETSKRTFYAHSAGKDACLLELLDIDNIRTIAGIRATVDPDADWRRQVEQAVNAYLVAIAANPGDHARLDSRIPGAG